MKCIIFAVPFSSNLGDGIIYECIKAGLTHSTPELSVDCVDISGRTKFETQKKTNEIASRKFLTLMPSWIRPVFPAIKFGILSRKKLLAHYSNPLASADFVIIGGGQLFSDLALNFPIKIHLLSTALSQNRTQAAIYSVGVPKKISTLGKILFRSALARINPKMLTTRDPLSLDRISNLFDLNQTKAGIVFDPAVITSIVYPAPARNNAKTRLGISVIADVAVQLGRKTTTIDARTKSFYVELGATLLAKGYDLVYLTNGSHDDQDYLNELVEANKDFFSSPNITIAAQPFSPKELADSISCLDGIIADRLHANIIAYSYGIPSVGFSRDEKCPTFFESVNRSAFCIAEDATPLHAADTLINALKTKVSQAELEVNIQKTLAELQSIVAHFSSPQV